MHQGISVSISSKIVGLQPMTSPPSSLGSTPFFSVTGFAMANDSIQSLLNDPNNASPANVEAASLHRENLKEYVKRVRETVEESWECDGE